MAGKHFHQLPLRKLGFEYVPAVPVDIPGMVDTLVIPEVVMGLGSGSGGRREFHPPAPTDPGVT